MSKKLNKISVNALLVNMQEHQMIWIWNSAGKEFIKYLSANFETVFDKFIPVVQPNTEFGYSRKDVLLIGAGFIALGYGLYYGAQAAGIEKTTAGNYVQMFIFLIICVGYVSTYIFRVANKVWDFHPCPFSLLFIYPKDKEKSLGSFQV